MSDIEEWLANSIADHRERMGRKSAELDAKEFLMRVREAHKERRA